MLLRVLVGIIFCTLTFQGMSQSKKETVDWLLQKFEKFKKDRHLSDKHFEESKIAGRIEVTTYYSYTDYDYFINNDTLLIKCNFLAESSGKKDIKLILLSKIILSEISEISCSRTGIKFNTYDFSIKIFENGKVRKDLNNFDLGGFNCEGEDDLGNRIIKAFYHLRSFYPRLKRKEAF